MLAWASHTWVSDNLVADDLVASNLGIYRTSPSIKPQKLGGPPAEKTRGGRPRPILDKVFPYAALPFFSARAFSTPARSRNGDVTAEARFCRGVCSTPMR